MIARDHRGQATLELGLGLLVFVTVLLFGIHFAEVGWLSLKVQEAGAWAMWEATGAKVQDLQARNTTPFDTTLSAGGLQARTLNQYRDFNGLSSSAGGPIITAALTRGSGMRVECNRDSSLSFRPTSTVTGIYFDQGGLSCQVNSRLDGIRIPTAFLQNNASGFFKEDHNQPQPYYFCSVGKANGTSCNGRLSILTNDWGLAGDRASDDQSASCRLTGCTNTTYRKAVEDMFQGGGSAGRTFAQAHAGTAPTDANEYFFSYAGMEFGYWTPLGDEGGNSQFLTGGPGLGDVPSFTLHNCFLGKAGCN